MKLAHAVDRSAFRGLVAVEPWDAVLRRPTAAPCRVTALRKSDRAPVLRATPHPASGLHGFFTLKPGDYWLLIEPLAPELLPSLRSLHVANPPAPLGVVRAPLLPSPRYSAPVGAAVLRGTVEWKSPRLPARWAAVYATVASSKPLDRPILPALTRSDARGEFALVLRTAPPGIDGVRATFTATIEIRAAFDATPRDPDDLADLPPDDGVDFAAVKDAQPLKRGPFDEIIVAGKDRSINSDSYSVLQVTAGGATRAVANRVIQIA